MTCGRIFRCFDDAKYIGPAGKGIASVVIDANWHLIITYTDGTTSDAGLITGGAGSGVAGATVNEEGHLILTFSDGSTVDAGYVVGPQGPQGPPGTGSGSAAQRTYYASQYATAQEAVDAAKGQRLVLDKMFNVTAPVTLFGSGYEGTCIVGTDNKGTGFKAVGAFDGFVLDIRSNYITLENFTIDGGAYDGVGGLAIGDRSVQEYTASRRSWREPHR